MNKFIKSLFTTTAGSVILGSIIISLAILISGGVIKFKGATTSTPSSPAQTAAQLPNQPTQQAPAAPSKVDATLGHLPFKGTHGAKVAIVEFGDLRCPFCKRFFDDTESQVLKDYVDSGKALFAFRHFEFLGPASITAGNAVECANEQSKFWEMHDYLYKNQPSESDTSLYTSDKLAPIAQSLGMDITQFKSCLDTTKYTKNLSDDQAAGQQAGVSGTPSFVIGKLDATGTKIVGGQLIVGAQPYTAIKAAIDQALQ